MPGPSNITCVFPLPAADLTKVEEWAPHARQAQVVVLRLRDGSGDVFHRWVVDGVTALLVELKRILGQEPQQGEPYRSVVVVIWCSSGHDARGRAAAAAVREAARGIIQALTQEYAAALRCNVVLVDDLTCGSVPDTLAFLASPTSGSVAGATFDIMGAT